MFQELSNRLFYPQGVTTCSTKGGQCARRGFYFIVSHKMSSKLNHVYSVKKAHKSLSSPVQNKSVSLDLS